MRDCNNHHSNSNNNTDMETFLLLYNIDTNNSIIPNRDMLKQDKLVHRSSGSNLTVEREWGR